MHRFVRFFTQKRAWNLIAVAFFACLGVWVHVAFFGATGGAFPRLFIPIIFGTIIIMTKPLPEALVWALVTSWLLDYMESIPGGWYVMMIWGYGVQVLKKWYHHFFDASSLTGGAAVGLCLALLAIGANGLRWWMLGQSSYFSARYLIGEGAAFALFHALAAGLAAGIMSMKQGRRQLPAI